MRVASLFFVLQQKLSGSLWCNGVESEGSSNTPDTRAVKVGTRSENDMAALPERPGPAMAVPQTFSSSGHIVYSEILSVTSVMRKHSRWSSSTQTLLFTRDQARDSAHTSLSHLGIRRSDTTGMQQGSKEDVLMPSFEQLKRTLRSTEGKLRVVPPARRPR